MADNAAPSGLTVTAQAAADGVTTYSVSIETMIIFAALSFIPALILMMTSFTRIVIVLSLMRQALGLQTTPPNQVIIGMSLFLTFFVMSPTLEKIYVQAYQPYSAQEISLGEATAKASAELREFMLVQTRQADIELFASIAGEPEDSGNTAIPMRIMIPAFVISELKTAFQIGFLVFIPFLVIDLVVASVLMSMGMMMLSPVLVSLPFKLMLFVLADGWHLLIGSMVASFGPGG
ncbi:MAG: flagellar type III secretion system pore protein FliP [Burkholderiaceae bacterium]